MQGSGRASDGNFVLTEVTVTDAQGKAVGLAHASATFEQSGLPAALKDFARGVKRWFWKGRSRNRTVEPSKLAERRGG